MKLLMYGITEETVAKDEFESYRLTPKEKEEQMNMFLSFDGVHEVFIFTMCQRMEYYLYVDETTFSHGEFLRYIAEYTSKPLDEVILETTSKFNEDVIRHLYELMGGFLEHSKNQVKIYCLVKWLLNELKDFENRQMLKELFQKAVQFAIESKFEIQLQPLMHDIIPQAITLIRKYVDSLDGLSLFFVGDAQQLLEVYTLLENVSIQSLTFATTPEELRKLNDELKIKPNNIKISAIESSGYELAKADVVFVLEELIEEELGKEKINELVMVRQTPKKQYIIDIKDTLIGQELQRREGAKKLSLRSYEDYSFEEREEAKHYLDKMLDVIVEQITNKYLTE